MHALTRASVAAILAGGLALVPAPVSTQTPPSNAPYQDLSLSFDARARDLVGASDTRREDRPVDERRAGDPAARRAGLQLVERSAARRRPGRCRHRVPAGHRHGGVVRRAADARVATAIGDEAPRQAPRVRAARRARRLPGADLLVARTSTSSATRAGAAARRPTARIPYLTARMGVAFVKGAAGRRPEVPEDRRHGQALRRPQRPRADRHTFDASPSERDLHETYLPAFQALVQEAKVASVMGAYNRVNGESASASPRFLGRDPAPRLGLRRLRRVRLRRHRRHLHRPQVVEHGRGSGGAGGQGEAAISSAARSTSRSKTAVERRADHREGDRRRADAAVLRALQARACSIRRSA